ncbi:MAG: DsbC family protein, partial [Burkholderiaceae bacterium]
MPHRTFLAALALATLGAFAPAARADEAVIRKNLVERLPADFPKIDEVTKTPIPGLWEV